MCRPSGTLRELRENQKTVVNMDCFKKLFNKLGGAEGSNDDGSGEGGGG